MATHHPLPHPNPILADDEHHAWRAISTEMITVVRAALAPTTAPTTTTPPDSLPLDTNEHAAAQRRVADAAWAAIARLVAHLARARGLAPEHAAIDPALHAPPITTEGDHRLRALADAAHHAPPTRIARLLSMAHEASLSWSVRHDPNTGSITIRIAGGTARHAAGAFSTPTQLIEHLLDQTLEPAIDQQLRHARHPIDALLDFRVCDPAAGVGRFLIAAAWRLAHRLADLRAKPHANPTAPTPPHTPDHAAARDALPDIAARCLVGIDIDARAIALCRAALWLEAASPRLTPADLAPTIRTANALLGAPRWLTPPPHTSNDDDHHAARAHADQWCIAAMATPRRRPPIEPTNSTPSTNTDPANHRPPFFHWNLEHPEGFHAVLGNPPFLGQLRADTAAHRPLSALLRAATDGAVRRYADIAAAFLIRAIDLARPAGRVGLVLPRSILATHDARTVRAAAASLANLESIWTSAQPVFPGTAVAACAITLARHAHHQPTEQPLRIARHIGPTFQPLTPLTIARQRLIDAETWAPLIAPADNLPELSIHDHAPTIATIARATADFRDQYYALTGHLIEHEQLAQLHRTNPDTHTDPSTDPRAFPPLITTALIALAHHRWGRAPTTIHKRRWAAPRVDARAMRATPASAAWLDARLIPKILVPTQTPVLHALVDEPGHLLPAVPVITVVPHDPANLWPLAAAIASPVATAIAAARYAGTALSPNAIKLSARQLMGLPLPTNTHAWRHATAAFRQLADHTEATEQRRNALHEFARASAHAANLDNHTAAALLRWWLQRQHQPAPTNPTLTGTPSCSTRSAPPPCSTRPASDS